MTKLLNSISILDVILNALHLDEVETLPKVDLPLQDLRILISTKIRYKYSIYLNYLKKFLCYKDFTLNVTFIFGDLLSAVTLYCGPFNSLEGAFAGFSNSSVLPEA